MAPSSWRRLVTPLLDETWRVARDFVYSKPVGAVINGVLIESSARKAHVYVWLLRIPLFVPTDVVDLSWSVRVGGPSTAFDTEDESARDAVREAMLLARADAVAGDMPDPPGGELNVRMMEASAYSCVLDDDPNRAIEMLERVTSYKADRPWDAEMLERADNVLQLLLRGNVSAVTQQLHEWRAQSLAALGISTD